MFMCCALMWKTSQTTAHTMAELYVLWWQTAHSMDSDMLQNLLAQYTVALLILIYGCPANYVCCGVIL